MEDILDNVAMLSSLNNVIDNWIQQYMKQPILYLMAVSFRRTVLEDLNKILSNSYVHRIHYDIIELKLHYLQKTFSVLEREHNKNLTVSDGTNNPFLGRYEGDG